MVNVIEQNCPSAILKAKMVIGDGQKQQYYFPRLQVKPQTKRRVLESDDVIIEPIYTGVCGTDISILSTDENGALKFKGPTKLPVIIGHEYSGVVIESGKNSRFKPGDYVVSESIEACGQCEQCQLGHLNQCLYIELIGLTKDGAFSNSVQVKDRHVYSIQKLIDRYGLNKGLQIAALLEPAGCAYNGLMIDAHGNTVSKVVAGSRVAVFGCGPIGLLNVALAKAQGAETVVAFDYIQSKIDLALKMGADDAFLVDKCLPDNYLSANNGHRANLVVEASGDFKAIESAFSIIAPRGILLVKSRMPVSDISVDPNFLVSQAITMIGVRGHAGYGIYRDLIDWFSKGRVNFDDFIYQKKFSFFDILEAIEEAKTAAGKVLCINPKYIKKFCGSDFGSG